MTSANDDAIDFHGVRITLQDASDFMNEVSTGTQDCPVCGRIEWEFVFNDNDGGFAALPARKVEVEDGSDEPALKSTGRAVPVFGVVCSHCGYLRIHAMITLRKWVAAKSEAAARE